MCLRSDYRTTAIFLCSYCPVKTNKSEIWQEKQTDAKKAKKSTNKGKGNNWASFSVFYLLKADRKKQKSAARSEEERRTEHKKIVMCS